MVRCLVQGYSMRLRHPPVTFCKDEENSAFTKVVRHELMREELAPRTTQDHLPSSSSQHCCCCCSFKQAPLPHPHPSTPGFSQVCESLSLWPWTSLTRRMLSHQLLRKLTLEDCFNQWQRETEVNRSLSPFLLIYPENSFGLFVAFGGFFAFVSKGKRLGMYFIRLPKGDTVSSITSWSQTGQVMNAFLHWLFIPYSHAPVSQFPNILTAHGLLEETRINQAQ